MCYKDYITYDYLISPLNGYRAKRISSQNISKFGFKDMDELEMLYPKFPRVCHKTALTFSSMNAGKIRKKIVKSIVDDSALRIEYDINPIFCKCGGIIPFDKKQNQFCSRKCANSRTHSLETKAKISSTWSDKRCSNISFTNYRICNECDEIIEKLKHKCKRCSTKLSDYRMLCKFTFNIYDYPNYFNLDLITTHGIYSPSNSNKPNMGGISRDHMISVKYGFTNNIDPFFLSHPANCALVLQTMNSSKKTKCTLTLEELIERIDQWDECNKVVVPVAGFEPALNGF